MRPDLTDMPALHVLTLFANAARGLVAHPPSTLNAMLDDVLTSAEQRCHDVRPMDRSVRGLRFRPPWGEGGVRVRGSRCERQPSLFPWTWTQVVDRIAGAAAGATNAE